ncbi:MAG: hypothetical protein AAGA56_23840 [Myxococcota bacterium]
MPPLPARFRSSLALCLVLAAAATACRSAAIVADDERGAAPAVPTVPATTAATSARAASAFEAEVEESIARASDYLVRHQRDDGSFVYLVNLNPEVSPPKKYNLLRHAGTLYALAQRVRGHPNVKIDRTLHRGHAFLRSKIGPLQVAREATSEGSPSPTEGGPSPAGEVPSPTGGGPSPVQSPSDGGPSLSEEISPSPPAVAVFSSPNVVKLGGAGLALTALETWAEADPSQADDATAEGLGHFIAAMQREDGSFYSKYYPKSQRFESKWVSLYYPGEAALGLLLLDRRRPGANFGRVAVRALTHLADRRRPLDRVPPDHWALIATAQWLQGPGRNASPPTRAALLEHARTIVDQLLDERIPRSKKSPLHGAWDSLGRTTPTATRLEGLLAMAPHLDPLRRDRIEAAAQPALAFLIRAQVKEGRHAGGIRRAMLTVDKKGREAERFNRRATEIRIDYVQHAMSAWMAWLDLRRRSEPPP